MLACNRENLVACKTAPACRIRELECVDAEVREGGEAFGRRSRCRHKLQSCRMTAEKLFNRSRLSNIGTAVCDCLKHRDEILRRGNRESIRGNRDDISTATVRQLEPDCHPV